MDFGGEVTFERGWLPEIDLEQVWMLRLKLTPEISMLMADGLCREWLEVDVFEVSFFFYCATHIAMSALVQRQHWKRE